MSWTVHIEQLSLTIATTSLNTSAQITIAVLLAGVQRAQDDKRQLERKAADALESARSSAAQNMQSQTEAHRQMCAEIEARMAADAVDAATTAAAVATAQEVNLEFVLFCSEPATSSRTAKPSLHNFSACWN